jgi:hypothetical protein
MNLKKSTPKLFIIAFFMVIGFKTLAQQPGCFMIPDLDGYKRAYKMNYGGAQGYKEFFKTYKDTYVDTAYYIANSLKAMSPIKSGWRLTDQVGPTFPYCGGLSQKSGNSNLSADENMFLKGGAYNNMEVDRMMGKKGMFGLGALGGYAYYGVDQKSYDTKYNNYWFPATKVPLSNATLLKSKPYEIFYLLAGPVATFGLGKKLTLDLTAKAGPAHNDVVYVGAKNTLTNEIIHRTQPTEKRWSLGGNAGMRLMYKFAENWGLGLNANAFNSNTKYETIDPSAVGSNYKLISRIFDRKQSNFNFGAAIQHIIPQEKRPIYVPLNRLDPPVAAPVAVAPSIVSPCNQSYSSTPFNNQFTWASNDNLADKANEMFTFKLYKVPSKEPIFAKTQKENTLDYALVAPTNVCDTDEYYYTVHSTKGASFSEMVTCSFKLKNAAADAAGCASAAALAAAKGEVKSAGPIYLTRILGNENFTRQIVKYDEGKGCKCPIDTLTKTGSKLVEYYKQYSDGRELSTWPDGLPIPRKATGFIYEVRQVFEPGVSGDQKAGPAERYRLDVDKRTRAVTLTPITSRKRGK